MAGIRPGGESPEGRARWPTTTDEARLTTGGAGATIGVMATELPGARGGNPDGGPRGRERTPHEDAAPGVDDEPGTSAKATRGPADVVVVAVASRAAATRRLAEGVAASVAACGMRAAPSSIDASVAACAMQAASVVEAGASSAARGARDVTGTSGG